MRFSLADCILKNAGGENGWGESALPRLSFWPKIPHKYHDPPPRAHDPNQNHPLFPQNDPSSKNDPGKPRASPGQGMGPTCGQNEASETLPDGSAPFWWLPWTCQLEACAVY